MRGRVVPDVYRLVARQRRLEIDERADRAVAVDLIVVDACRSGSAGYRRPAARALMSMPSSSIADAEIDADPAHRIGEVVEL